MKSLKNAIKRVNKSKDAVKSDFLQQQKVQHIKQLITDSFPILWEVETIYDGQTVANALSGFIKAHLEAKLQDFKMSDLTIDLSKEPDSKIKTAIEKLIELTKDENAKDTSETLERLGKVLGDYSAFTFMKSPMTDIKIEDILSK